MVEAGPLVTVVMPFDNDACINEAVSSVLDQTHSNVEMIVVGDGSTNQVEQLKGFGGRIHYLDMASGGGASALNVGFRLASGKYIAWLSSGARFYPEKIARQVQAMERAGGWISLTDFDLVDEHGHIAEKESAPIAAGTDFYRAFNNAADPVNGSTVMMRKLLFNQIGEFDEQLKHAHGIDYWYRVILAGFSFLMLPEPLTVCRGHASLDAMLHKDAIAAEIDRTQARYANRWETFTSNLVGR